MARPEAGLVEVCERERGAEEDVAAVLWHSIEWTVPALTLAS